MPQTCTQCQSQTADEATFCPSCGASLAPTATATAGGAPAAAATSPAAAASTGSSIPTYKFDVARWSLADRITGIATIVLFVSLFLPWFTASNVLASGSVNGLWHGWLYITLILSVAIVAYLVLRAGWDRLPINQEVPHV